MTLKIEMKFKLADQARRPKSTGPRWSLAQLTTVLLFAFAALVGWPTTNLPPVIAPPPVVVTQPSTS